MLARKQIVGPGQIAPADPPKPKRKPKKKRLFKLGFLQYLEFRSRIYGYCFESNAEMGLNRDLEERQIRRDLEQLEDLKLIERHYRGPHRRIYMTDAGLAILREESARKEKRRSQWPDQPHQMPGLPGQDNRSGGQDSRGSGHGVQEKDLTTQPTELPKSQEAASNISRDQVLSRIRQTMTQSTASHFEACFVGLENGRIILADGFPEHLSIWDGMEARHLWGGQR